MTNEELRSELLTIAALGSAHTHWSKARLLEAADELTRLTRENAELKAKLDAANDEALFRDLAP